MSEYRVGDKVTFTKTALNGRRGSISSVSGVIEIIELSIAKVKSKSKHYYIPLSKLRHEGQRSELTEAVLRMGESL